MRVLLGVIFTIGILVGCGQSDESKDQLDSIARVRVAKENMRKNLVDPSSAEFKDVHVYKNGSSGKIVCGYVNAKNRFGGYTGYEEFISIGKTTVSKSQGDPDFNAIWSSDCNNRYLVY